MVMKNLKNLFLVENIYSNKIVNAFTGTPAPKHSVEDEEDIKS